MNWRVKGLVTYIITIDKRKRKLDYIITKLKLITIKG